MSINIREFVKRAGEFTLNFIPARRGYLLLLTRRFNLKVSAGVRGGRKYGEYSLENNENEKKENDLWELGWVRLFKRKTYYCLAFVLYKRESLPSKFPECKQTINEAWVVSNCLFIFSRFLLFTHGNNFIEVTNSLENSRFFSGLVKLSAELFTTKGRNFQRAIKFNASTGGEFLD